MGDRGESQRADFLCHVPCQVDEYCDTQGYPECFSCEQGPCFPGQSPGSFESEKYCKLVCPGYFTAAKTGNGHVMITDVPPGGAANTSFGMEILLICVTVVIVLGLMIVIAVIIWSKKYPRSGHRDIEMSPLPQSSNGANGAAPRGRATQRENPDNSDEEENLAGERLTGVNGTLIRVEGEPHSRSPRNCLFQ